jgi:hypothetical protein
MAADTARRAKVAIEKELAPFGRKVTVAYEERGHYVFVTFASTEDARSQTFTIPRYVTRDGDVKAITQQVRRVLKRMGFDAEKLPTGTLGEALMRAKIEKEQAEASPPFEEEDPEDEIVETEDEEEVMEEAQPGLVIAEPAHVNGLNGHASIAADPPRRRGGQPGVKLPRFGEKNAISFARLLDRQEVGRMVSGEPGTPEAIYEYTEKWDDERVRQVLQLDVPVHLVIEKRKEIFGWLPGERKRPLSKPKGGEEGRIEMRIASLEGEVASLKEMLGDVVVRLAKAEKVTNALA